MKKHRMFLSTVLNLNFYYFLLKTWRVFLKSFLWHYNVDRTFFIAFREKSIHVSHLALTIPLFSVLIIAPSITFAEETPDRKFWGGIELGIGSVYLNTDDANTDSALYLNFKIGAVLSKQWLLGLELGGYSQEYGNLYDPSEGAGISRVFLVAQYYFKEEQNSWYVKGGGGYLSLWDNDESELEGSGWGAVVGLGYNWQTKGWGCFGPLVIMDYGKTGDLDHTSIAIALNWSSY